MTGAQAADWDAEFRPRKLRQLAVGVAALIAVSGIVVAVFNNRSSGAYLRPADQIAMGGIALMLAGGVLVLTRPRVRVGRQGLLVRNVVDDRLIPWSEVVDVSFPPGKRWARVEIGAYEYVPLVAIQLADRERAVDAMDTVRDLMARYKPH